MDSTKPTKMSRRKILKGATIAAAGAGANVLLGGNVLAAPQGGPAVLTNNQAGRRFRALVKLSKDAPSIVEVRARGLEARQIIVRTEAAQTCYTNVKEVVSGTDTTPTGTQVEIVGHGGVGIVEAIGPQVIRARVGDRVIVPDWSSCGSCYNCLRSRADKCMMRNATFVPTCDLDSTPIYSSRGGMSELMIVHEEQAVPIFTDLPSVDLAMLHCVGNCGLGMSMTNCRVEAASDVVVFGAGPVGLSAIQGSRINGASRIIVVEPIPYRRELALKLGATDAVDPNQYKERVSRPGSVYPNDALVEHLRDMVKQKTDRVWAGHGKVGPDHIIEAVGGDLVKPKEPQGPDPTGITVLNQCWELCSTIGTLVTCSVGQPAGSVVQIPASQWTDGSKHHWPGTAGGTNCRRDVPRYVRLMETGQLNMKALASKTYPLNQAKEAYAVAGDRTVVATIVTPNA